MSSVSLALHSRERAGPMKPGVPISAAPIMNSAIFAPVTSVATNSTGISRILAMISGTSCRLVTPLGSLKVSSIPSRGLSIFSNTITVNSSKRLLRKK